MSVVHLGGVKGCCKPHCCLAAPLNRHHKRHEAMWLNAWAHRGKEPRWVAFVRRYYKFHPADVVLICQDHHAEIHSIYDRLIAEDIVAVGKPLYKYSWVEAERLMSKLEKSCLEWLEKETPGIDSAGYEKTKRMRRGIAKRNAAKRKRNR